MNAPLCIESEAFTRVLFRGEDVSEVRKGKDGVFLLCNCSEIDGGDGV